MLTPHSIAVVQSTIPILQAHGELLTRHFYRRMFEHNPEVAPFFNPANQASGSQQKALAAAICAYASNLNNLGALGGAVELIAQKHASLQIQAEHYPIVGENLLASIREVLGEGATDEIIGAWGEAYGFLADILIGRENEIYRQNETAPGGWAGLKSFRVARKEIESDVITSFYLEPGDGGAVPAFQPGQYITLRVPSPCGHTTMRNYSLSDKPGQPWLRISVKRETGSGAATPDGFVSNFLHAGVQVGHALEVGPPCGEFVLNTAGAGQSRPLVLLSAGVGITPLMSMLLSALEAPATRPIVFIHAALHSGTQAFGRTLRELAGRHPHLTIHTRYSEPSAADRTEGNFQSEGFIDGALIESLIPGHDADYYFCGPKPFMATVHQQLSEWGIAPGQIHFEFFGPLQDLAKPALCPV